MVTSVGRQYLPKRRTFFVSALVYTVWDSLAIQRSCNKAAEVETEAELEVQTSKLVSLEGSDVVGQ